MDVSAAKPIRTVQVRELVEFALRSGDLVRESLFVGSDRALAGVRGHQKIQRSRPPDYQSEVPLEHVVEASEFILKIRGRIDGLLVRPEGTLLEEIKTVQGSWDKAGDPLHWAQAKFYGFIYAQQQRLPEIEVQLTYLELDNDAVTHLRQIFAFAELAEFCQNATRIYLEWLREQHRWCQIRDQSIRSLAFPFPQYRAGQRELAVAAYKTITNQGRLFAAAPTGIGKTMSVLFPAIKALGEGHCERIFYLTARTVGRAVAEKAHADLLASGLKLRAVTLTAREKQCVRDGSPCDPRTCPMAVGYYDRIRPAIRQALEAQAITRPVLETVAQKHQVCPFELALDTSLWVDAVICDYNYVFDPTVYLRRHFDEGSGDYAFLVDEAHNLVERAREMFSADLDGRELVELRRAVREAIPGCAKALGGLNRAIKSLAVPAETRATLGHDLDENPDLFGRHQSATHAPRGRVAEKAFSADAVAVSILRECPEVLAKKLDQALAETERWLAQNRPAEFREDLLSLYFRMHAFRRTAQHYDEHYLTILEQGPSPKVRLFCLDPSLRVRAALDRGRAAVFFSATLRPVDYYTAVLGGSKGDRQLQLTSPFPHHHFAVFAHTRIQTRFRKRADSLHQVVDAIETFVLARPGNYLVYFPSYEYLKAVADQLQARQLPVRLLVQRPGLKESEREEFLAAFSAETGDTLVGFAVMGGIFGEGIDLVGERLIGVVIVGVGLPPVCTERDLIRGYFQERNGAGFDYAYRFPGMNRVLQALGRVIRSEKDRGAALLIDERFRELAYRQLLPDWWQAVPVSAGAELENVLQDFWGTPAQSNGVAS